MFKKTSWDGRKRDKRAVHDTKYTTTSVRHGGMGMYSCQRSWFTIIYGLVCCVFTHVRHGVFFVSRLQKRSLAGLAWFFFPQRREMHIRHMRTLALTALGHLELSTTCLIRDPGSIHLSNSMSSVSMN